MKKMTSETRQWRIEKGQIAVSEETTGQKEKETEKEREASRKGRNKPNYTGGEKRRHHRGGQKGLRTTGEGEKRNEAEKPTTKKHYHNAQLTEEH